MGRLLYKPERRPPSFRRTSDTTATFSGTSELGVSPAIVVRADVPAYFILKFGCCECGINHLGTQVKSRVIYRHHVTDSSSRSRRGPATIC